jgi:hypothetical protein
LRSPKRIEHLTGLAGLVRPQAIAIKKQQQVAKKGHSILDFGFWILDFGIIPTTPKSGACNTEQILFFSTTESQGLETFCIFAQSKI